MARIEKPEHGSIEWLELRHRDQFGRVRFGASEAPTLMGVNPWSSIVDLALTKWTAPEVSEPNAAMERGNILEPALVAYSSQLLDQGVSTPNVMYAFGRLISTLDGISDDGEIIVEAKTTTAYSSDDELPVSYLWQGVAQLACVPSANEVLFVVLDKRMRLGSWRISRVGVADLIGELLVRADEVGDALDARRLPEGVSLGESQIKALFPSPVGEVELSSWVLSVLDDWQRTKTDIRALELQEQKLRDELARAMGNAEIGTVDGQAVVSFKSRRGSMRWDTKALERDHPELAAAYRVEGASFRVLKDL